MKSYVFYFFDGYVNIVKICWWTDVFRVVNVTCGDFVRFTLILHCSRQVWSRLRWCWSFSVARTGSGSDDSIAVLSADIAMNVSCMN